MGTRSGLPRRCRVGVGCVESGIDFGGRNRLGESGRGWCGLLVVLVLVTAACAVAGSPALPGGRLAGGGGDSLLHLALVLAVGVTGSAGVGSRATGGCGLSKMVVESRIRGSRAHGDIRVEVGEGVGERGTMLSLARGRRRPRGGGGSW